MKKIRNPKILIPLVIILIALGAFAATTMIGNHDHGSSSHGHQH